MLDTEKLLKPRTTYCRQMARKAYKCCAKIFKEGWPKDIFQAVKIVLPGFVIVNLEKLPSGVNAIIDIEQKCIGINASLSHESKRLSIAHEIGHVWLDHPNYVFEIKGRQDAILETEATLFAREFLIPLNTLKLAFRECRDWEQLAHKFEVDRETMYYRFKESGLFRQVW